MLQSVSGGAAARPFRTHFNALDCDFNLRIALELHLKRMLVGGFDRVLKSVAFFATKAYLVGTTPSLLCLKPTRHTRIFRGMMELTRSLIQQVAERALGNLQYRAARG